MCDNLSSSAGIPSSTPTDEATNRNECGKVMKRGSPYVEEVKEDTCLMMGESRICEGKGSEKSTRKVGSTTSSSSGFLGESTSASSESTALESSASVKNGNTSLENSPSSKSSKENGAEVSIVGVDKVVLRKGTSAVVVGKGTKLMKTLKFPTVITRLRNISLHSSTVYYVMLESESGEFAGEIPALLLSSPYSSSRRTQSAELLPLCVEQSKDNPDIVSVTPMLLNKCYKRMFGRRCSFKIKAIESGRSIDWSVEYSWNVWNLGFKEFQDIITAILYKDIREMPMTMTSTLSPLKRCRRMSSSTSGSDKVLSLSECFSNGQAQDSAECKLSDYCTDLKFSGVAASGVSTFADWFKALPPNVHIDEDFECDRGTTLSKDMFSDMQMFDRYLCVSDTM